MSRLDERELLAFAAEIAGYQRPSVSSALRARLRGSLMAAPVTPSPGPALAWPRAAALRPVVAAVLLIAIVAAAGGAAAASSAPGDPAFTLKRAAEQIQVTLAPDDAARLDTLVGQSDRRLGDLKTTAENRPSSGTAATDAYRAAVDRVDAALASLLTRPATSARDAAIARAAAASADHIAALESLAAQLPASAQQGIERAIEAQQTVHGKSGQAPGQPGDPGGIRPPGVPGGPPPGRGGPPIKVPGRP